MSTIGLGLMIRNEAKNLVEFLNQCVSFADIFCIVDTGSSDNSKEIALSWGKSSKDKKVIYIEAKKMVSEEINGEWLINDFALARNIYVETLDPLVDYVFTASVGNIIHAPHKIKEVIKSNNKVYGFKIKRGIGTFTHHRLFKTKLGIRYFGAVHEYPDIWRAKEDPVDTGLVITHECGNQSSQESSAKRNLRILEREYKKKPSSRTLFYYAMALRDCKLHKEAVKIYDEYLAGPDLYHDERMFAHYYKMCCLSTYHPNDAIKAGYKALADDQRFSEIPMLMAYMYWNAKRYDKALAMCLLAQQQPPKSDMFLELCKYKQEPLDMINKIQNLKVAKKNS